MAELVAAGYSLGGDTIGRARAYDEEHMRVIARAKEAAAAVKAKLESLDEKYGVTAKLTEVSRKVNAELAKVCPFFLGGGVCGCLKIFFC